VPGSSDLERSLLLELEIVHEANHPARSGLRSALGEHPILDATQLRESARGGRRIGNEAEAKIVARRPCHRRLTHDEFPRRTRCGDGSTAGYGAAPLDVKAATRAHRYRRLETQQGIRNVEIVCHHQVGRAQLRGAVAEIDGAIRREGDGPEQSARIGVDTWVEVVDLGREVYEVILTSVEVKSH
jgi:hypothetical protein